GTVRNNLADELHRLGRLDDARREIRRAIECDALFGHTAEPWTAWTNLALIETTAGNSAAAEDAKRKAIASYLAYRRDGGENHSVDGRITQAVMASLLAGNPAEATKGLQQLSADSTAATFLPFIHALQEIVTGNRDRILADASTLDFREAA